MKTAFSIHLQGRSYIIIKSCSPIVESINSFVRVPIHRVMPLKVKTLEFSLTRAPNYFMTSRFTVAYNIDTMPISELMPVL